MAKATAWQIRPLEPCNPVVFLDTLRVHIRSDGAVSNKAVFVVLAILPEGTRDALGLWFQANEGAKFWAKVLNDLRDRRVQDILIAVVDAVAAKATHWWRSTTVTRPPDTPPSHQAGDGPGTG